MRIYKRAYNSLGIIISAIGLALTPFLTYIVNLPDSIEHINVIYWLMIANTSVSYFFSYRRSLLLADQRSDVNTKNLVFFRTVRVILLTVVLLLTKNFILYLTADIINTLISDIHITYVIKKNYSYIENASPSVLEKSEKINIVKYMSSGLLFKIGQMVVNSTDNIIISSFISTTLVGFYSNYYMLCANINAFIYNVFNSITASVGNFAVQKTGSEL